MNIISIIVLILLLFSFCLSYTALHGYMSKMIEYMSYKKGKEKQAKKYKGYLHTAGGIVRISLVGILMMFNWKIGLTYALFSFTFFDALLNAWRGLDFYHFTGTCEHWGNGFDFDCVWIWIQKHLKIQPIVFKLIISLIISYFIWS